jgi:6-phosphogluconolactonase
MTVFNHRVGLAARIFGILLALPALSSAAQESPPAAPATLWVYLGTYTNSGGPGIYLCHLDMTSGKLQLVGPAGEAKNPSFLALHPTRPLLYAVNEVGDFGGQRAGAVSAFSIQPKTGKLALLNRQSSGGDGPCHLTVDHSGRWVLAANYGGGSVVCLPIQADGRLGDATCFIQHRGSGANPQRQEGPHAHSINLDAANRFALVADLGLDKVLIYRFDQALGKLLPRDGPPSAALPPGAGPRHLAFHPNGRWAYVISEMANTVTHFKYDAARGTLQAMESVSTLPADCHGKSFTAEVQVHPSGKFLYGSNRGHDSIAVFAIDSQTGRLRAIGCEPTQGKVPRNFGIDPTGHYLLAANQETGNVVVFRMDAASGKLQATGSEVKVPAPVCVRITKPVEDKQ